MMWVRGVLSVFALCALSLLSYYSWQHNINIINLESTLANSTKLCASQDAKTWNKLDDLMERFSERENVVVHRLEEFLEDLQYLSSEDSSSRDGKTDSDNDFELIEKPEGWHQSSQDDENNENDPLYKIEFGNDMVTTTEENKVEDAKSSLQPKKIKDKYATWLDRARKRKTHNSIDVYHSASKGLDWENNNTIDKRCIALMIDSVRTGFVGKSRDVEINLKALSICRNNEPKSVSSVLPSNDEYSILGLVLSFGKECASLKRNNPSSLGQKWSALLGRNGLLEFGEIVVNDAESEVCESISKMIMTSTISHEKLSKLLSKDFLDKIESAKIKELVTSLAEHIKFAEDVEAAVVM